MVLDFCCSILCLYSRFFVFFFFPSAFNGSSGDGRLTLLFLVSDQLVLALLLLQKQGAPVSYPHRYRRHSSCNHRIRLYYLKVERTDRGGRAFEWNVSWYMRSRIARKRINKFAISFVGAEVIVERWWLCHFKYLRGCK